MSLFLRINTAVLIMSCTSVSYAGFNDLLKQGQQLLAKPPALQSSSTVSDIDSKNLTMGLKEALEIGGKRAIEKLSTSGGYLNSSDVRIPMPNILESASSTLKRFGLGSQVDAFERSMNNAAEQAVSEATPIFINTLSEMTVEDAQAIYSGGGTSATDYFKQKTSTHLADKMRPLIEAAMSSTGATRYYTALVEKAGKTMPFLANKTPNLGEHVTDAALEGLFLRLGQEEQKIRENPAARTTDLLKSVFGER